MRNLTLAWTLLATTGSCFIAAFYCYAYLTTTGPEPYRALSLFWLGICLVHGLGGVGITIWWPNSPRRHPHDKIQ